VYRWWYYKKDTVLLSGCLFGISFICLGNMAGNSIAFAVRVLAAANPDGPEATKEVVRGVALAAATFACVIHAISRRGGIWLSNVLASVKVGILLLIVVLAIKHKPSVVAENFADSFLAPKIPKWAQTCNHPVGAENKNGYTKAFLSISELLPSDYQCALASDQLLVFAYSGFDQANYVIE
jgi:amino acid transporter